MFLVVNPTALVGFLWWITFIVLRITMSKFSGRSYKMNDFIITSPVKVIPVDQCFIWEAILCLLFAHFSWEIGETKQADNNSIWAAEDNSSAPTASSKPQLITIATQHWHLIAAYQSPPNIDIISRPLPRHAYALSPSLQLAIRTT